MPDDPFVIRKTVRAYTVLLCAESVRGICFLMLIDHFEILMLLNIDKSTFSIGLALGMTMGQVRP